MASSSRLSACSRSNRVSSSDQDMLCTTERTRACFPLVFLVAGLLMLLVIARRLCYPSVVTTAEGHGQNRGNQKEDPDIWSLLQKATSKNISDCDKRLLAVKPLADFNMSSDYWSMKPRFDEALSEVFSDEKHRLAGHSGRVQTQARLLHYLASRPWVRTVCETGFHAGNSSFNYLTASRELIVHSFDLATTSYTLPMARALEKLFSGRLFLHVGDSIGSVPRFIASSSET